MNVLSLFNGMSFGKMALESLSVTVTKYYSSEIDKYANQATQAMFPDTIQLGDILNWREWPIDWVNINLVTGGFPCQPWSPAGLGEGDKDERGMLFWVMLDIMKHIRYHNPKADFLIENVKMKKEFEKYITTHTENALGKVHKILINSSLVSAQNRNRYYWTSFKVEQPAEKGVTWGNVREHGVDGFYYTEKGLQWLGRHSARNNKHLNVWSSNEKAQMIEASHYKNYSSQRFFGVCDVPSDKSMIASMRGRRINEEGKRSDYDKSIHTEQYIEFKYDDKSNCISTVQKDNVVIPFTLPHRIPVDMFFFRYVTPRECFRLQTVPEHHIDTLLSAGISNTQLYKMCGNGWTMEVIKHIFKAMVND